MSSGIPLRHRVAVLLMWVVAGCSGKSDKTSIDEDLACEPTTCEAEGQTCGMLDDGCGNTLDCGECVACEPTTCEAEGQTCGMLDDACGNTLDCGECVACEPTTCEAEGQTCGMLDDACGDTLDCGECECTGELMSERRHAQGAQSSGFPASEDAYNELYDLPCASDDDCIAGCDLRGGTEEMCAASKCVESTENYCLPATVWRNLGALRAEGSEVTDGAQLVLVSDPYADFLLADDFKLEVPASAEIQGITVTIRRAGGNDDSAVDGAVRLIKGGVIGAADRSSPTPWTGPEYVDVDYGGEDDLWGETWTPADVNAADFGVALSTLYTQSAGNGRAYVDIIYVTVHYRECD